MSPVGCRSCRSRPAPCPGRVGHHGHRHLRRGSPLHAPARPGCSGRPGAPASADPLAQLAVGICMGTPTPPRPAVIKHTRGSRAPVCCARCAKATPTTSCGIPAGRLAPGTRHTVASVSADWQALLVLAHRFTATILTPSSQPGSASALLPSALTPISQRPSALPGHWHGGESARTTAIASWNAQGPGGLVCRPGRTRPTEAPL